MFVQKKKSMLHAVCFFVASFLAVEEDRMTRPS
jgi:hypothetical protein